VRSVTDAPGRSHDLDQVRQLLFPDLPPAEGWAKIEAAITGAADAKRMDAIEELADGDMSSDLLELLRSLREAQQAKPS
jgi:hypothetical protein